MENSQSKPAQPQKKSETATSSAQPKSAFEGKPSGTPVMQSFSTPKKAASPVMVLFILVLMAAFGVGTGYGVASMSSAKPGEKSALPNALNPNAPAKGETYGSDDTAAYKDTAEGVLKEGGIEGEGQYHLERPGGESQYVYMTSSTVDLSKFIDKKIKVWGATQTAQTAGWLMDVGKVEVQ
ncbi:MAG: hypothetical protein H0W89_03450 [Candidatus Levybacteria bacterium]|nr:hypothetical protein [Candidatus Levybacteria bacterium]